MSDSKKLIKLINGVWHIRKHEGDSFEVMRANEVTARGLVNEGDGYTPPTNDD